MWNFAGSMSTMKMVPTKFESLLHQAAKSAPFLLGQVDDVVDTVNEVGDEIIDETTCLDDECWLDTEPNADYCAQNYDPYACPYQSYDDYNYAPTPSKEDVHVMVWTSLWQWGIPALLFSILNEQAYADDNDGDVLPEGEESTDHYTREVSAWLEISEINFVVWAPTFLVGLFGLSEILMPVVAFWFEHVLSNLMWFAYLRAAYLMVEVAILEGNSEHWLKFGGWFIMNWIIYSGQVSTATTAINFLNYNEEYYDEYLRPSLFYLLKWIEHTPRSEHENHYNSYSVAL